MNLIAGITQLTRLTSPRSFAPPVSEAPTARHDGLGRLSSNQQLCTAWESLGQKPRKQPEDQALAEAIARALQPASPAVRKKGPEGVPPMKSRSAAKQAGGSRSQHPRAARGGGRPGGLAGGARPGGGKPGGLAGGTRPGGGKPGGLAGGAHPGGPAGGARPGGLAGGARPGAGGSFKPSPASDAPKPAGPAGPSGLGQQIQARVQGAIKSQKFGSAPTLGGRDPLSSNPVGFSPKLGGREPLSTQPVGYSPSLGGKDPISTQPTGYAPRQDGKLGSLGNNLDNYDASFLAAGERWGVPPERLKAMAMIESGGDPNALQINPTHGNTAGLMQINANIWGDEARRLGYDLNTPEGQIGMAGYILKQGYQERGSWDEASSWYFNPSGGGDSVNGTTNQQYMDMANQYIAQMAS